MILRRLVLIESLISVILGFTIAQVCAIVILPILGYQYHFVDLLLLNAITTVLAFIKNIVVLYVCRKYIGVKE